MSHQDIALQLQQLGAGDFQHLNGDLLSHLEGTVTILTQYQARPALQRAGLYHAAYGTAGFEQALVATEQRAKIRGLLGTEAEDIVYHYCACDRDKVWPQFQDIIVNAEQLTYHNRFTQAQYTLTPQQWRDFCQLTLCNEMELAQHSRDFVQNHGGFLWDLSVRMRTWVGDAMLQGAKEAFVE